MRTGDEGSLTHASEDAVVIPALSLFVSHGVERVMFREIIFDLIDKFMELVYFPLSLESEFLDLGPNFFRVFISF
jgi:hypothetical protein